MLNKTLNNWRESHQQPRKALIAAEYVGLEAGVTEGFPGGLICFGGLVPLLPSSGAQHTPAFSFRGVIC